jgi:hypothetical protein
MYPKVRLFEGVVECPIFTLRTPFQFMKAEAAGLSGKGVSYPCTPELGYPMFGVPLLPSGDTS